MITILSYHPGLSGDFLAYNIHQDKKYFNINHLFYKKIETNRYLFPCLTSSVLGWEIKDDFKNLIDYDINKLNTYYKKNIILPTHFYEHVTYHEKCKYVRLYTKNETILKLSFVMWWIKSHMISKSAPDGMNKLPKNSIKTELITKFQKWKYLSYKLNFMNNKSFDLWYYLKNIYNLYIVQASKCNKKEFEHIDVYETIYKGNYKIIEDIFDVEIDKNLIKRYACMNKELLNKINIDINSENFLNQLFSYIKNNIKTVDLRKYHNYDI